MSNESLVAWRTDTSIVLVGTLPLQDLESASVLVEEYLSDTGGWVPDDIADPTGPGEPATGETAPQAAASITELQKERIYNVSVTANLNVNFHVVQNLDPDQPIEDVLVLIQETVENFIEDQLSGTNLELADIASYDGTTTRGGNTTAAQRVQADTDVKSGDELFDPVSIGLEYARDRFELDDMWNVSYIYNEPDQDIVVQVERYTNTTYETLDIFTLTQHIVTIDAVSYQLATGVSKTRTEE